MELKMTLDVLEDAFKHFFHKKSIDGTDNSFGNKCNVGPDLGFDQLISIWTGDDFTSAISKIVEQKKEIDERFKHITSADILAGIQLEDKYTDIRKLDCAKFKFPYLDIVDVSPHEHLINHKEKVPDAHLECSDQSETREKTGNVWATPVVRYNNPFDQRLTFNGFLFNGTKSNTDAITAKSQSFLNKANFNCLLTCENGLSLADDYFRQYRLYSASLRADISHSLDDAAHSAGGKLEADNDVLPAFVDNSENAKKLWGKIRGTRRFWSGEEETKYTQKNSEDIEKSSFSARRHISKDNATPIPVIVRSGRGRSYKKFRSLNRPGLRDIDQGVITEKEENDKQPSSGKEENDRQPSTMNQTYQDQTGRKPTGRSRRDIYEWLSSIQNGHEENASRKANSKEIRRDRAEGNDVISESTVKDQNVHRLRDDVTLSEWRNGSAADNAYQCPEAGIHGTRPATVSCPHGVQNYQTDTSNMEKPTFSKTLKMPTRPHQKSCTDNVHCSKSTQPEPSQIEDAVKPEHLSKPLERWSDYGRNSENASVDVPVKSEQKPQYQLRVMESHRPGFPPQTSMFWSHHQRQSKPSSYKNPKHQPGTTTIHPKHEQSGGFNSVSDQQTGQQAVFYPTERLHHFNEQPTQQQFHHQQQQQQQQDRHYDHHLQQRQQHNDVYQQQQHNETHSQSASQCINHYMYAYPPPMPGFIAQSDQTQNLKFDDEVWYIDGVPYQHARPIATPINVQSHNPSVPSVPSMQPSNMPQGQWGHSLNPETLVQTNPATGYHTYKTTQNFSSRLTPAVQYANSSGYHLGIPLQVNEVNDHFYGLHINSHTDMNRNNNASGDVDNDVTDYVEKSDHIDSNDALTPLFPSCDQPVQLEESFPSLVTCNLTSTGDKSFEGNRNEHHLHLQSKRVHSSEGGSNERGDCILTMKNASSSDENIFNEKVSENEIGLPEVETRASNQTYYEGKSVCSTVNQSIVENVSLGYEKCIPKSSKGRKVKVIRPGRKCCQNRSGSITKRLKKSQLKRSSLITIL